MWQRDQSGRDATASTTGSVPIPRLARALALRARCPAGLYPPPPFPLCPQFTSHHAHAPGWIWLSSVASRVTVEDLRSLLSSRGLPTRGRKTDLLERCRVHGVALQRAPGVTAETGASRVPPPVGARGVSGGGASGGGEVGTVNTPSQSLSVTRGTTQGPDASLQASIPPVSGAPRVGGAGAAAAAAVPMGGPRAADRAPAFCKNERARLAHILSTPDVAAGVITSRGGMSRQQQDARQSRGAVWVVVVAPLFNGSDLFDVPVECADGGIDPNAHPHHRTGETLKAKWSEVCRGLPIRTV